MGQNLESLFSSPSPPPPPPSPKVLPKAWRSTPWDDKATSQQYLQEFQPGNEQITSLRIMLYGPVGAGKSSFINSVNNIFKGRITSEALVDSTGSGASFTFQYKTHKIKSCPIVFNDIMGLEKETTRGAHPNDIILALKGHVKDGYKFNPVSALAENDGPYIKTPTLDDRVHCLVCVVQAETVKRMTNEVVQKMRDIRLAASEMGIPQMAILTGIDEACPEVKKNIRQVYLSKYIKDTMELFSKSLGIPVNCIFPVSNYHDQIDLVKDMDVLILRSLKQMVDFGDDFSMKL